MRDVDEEMAKNLEWTLENDVSDLDLTFSHCLEYNGTYHEVDLKPDGCTILVTEQVLLESLTFLGAGFDCVYTSPNLYEPTHV